jgi:hypothetical protein
LLCLLQPPALCAAKGSFRVVVVLPNGSPDDEDARPAFELNGSRDRRDRSSSPTLENGEDEDEDDEDAALVRAETTLFPFVFAIVCIVVVDTLALVLRPDVDVDVGRIRPPVDIGRTAAEVCRVESNRSR